MAATPANVLEAVRRLSMAPSPQSAVGFALALAQADQRTVIGTAVHADKEYHTQLRHAEEQLALYWELVAVLGRVQATLNRDVSRMPLPPTSARAALAWLRGQVGEAVHAVLLKTGH